MKKICFVFALFCLLFFAVSCDSGIKFDNPKDQHNADKQDSGDTEQSDDSDPIDSEPEDTDTDDDSDTTPEEPDNSDSEPEDTDTDDPEDDTDSGDTADEDYTEDITDTGTETGETRVQDCSELPENAQWNTVSAIVQSWDGEKWVPSSKTSFNLEGSEDECRFKCSTNYGWDGSKCDADTRNVYCDNLPEHAQWNDGGRNGTFAQTWNGEVWVPTSHDAVYSKTPAECGFICVTGYVWDGSQCDTAPTQSAKCTGLPSGAEWNTASSITQTWDGEKWVPESTAGVYNTTASTTECRFKCKTNYTWSGSACVANTKVSPCMNLPENASWNTASSITQTWDGEDWQPSTTGTYNTTSSTTQCRFKCNTNYTWNGSICAADTKVGNCPSKPANTVWNDGGANGTFTQTWNGEDWIPAGYDSSYSQTEGTCKYKCDTGYAWNSGVCETASTRTAACQSKPENTVWNTVSEITQTYTGSGWQPSTTPVYNETSSESECRYKCASGYNWNGNSCTDSSVSGTFTLGNICTGQTSCYNASSSMTCPTSSSADFFGQDAQYAAQGTCTPQSFTVQTISSEKVVLDNNTGLMWQQTIPTSTYWGKAVSYCENLEYASYTDWRLPTPKELLTIVDNSKYDPAIDTTYFPNTPSSYFWSSSPDADDTPYAWSVGFNNGDGYNHAKSYNYLYVRCVRGAALPTGSFTSSTTQGDVIVTDTETGLIWQKTYVSGKTWQQALFYCESLTYAGYSDWRLPNKNELASLVNYEKYNNPASDFPDMPSQDFWSSSTYASDTSYAWRVYFRSTYFNYGSNVGYIHKTNDLPVRCVR